MKSELKKLRGTTIKTTQGEYILKEYFDDELSDFDFIYYTLNADDCIAKVYNLESSVSVLRFQNQTFNFREKKLEALAECFVAEQFKIRKKSYGLIVLKDIVKGCSLKDTGFKVSQLDLIELAHSLIRSALQLKNKKLIFCNFQPSNIYKTSKGEYKLINCEYLQKQGIKSQFPNIFWHSIQKDFRYACPLLLDQYKYETLNYGCDIFSMGCILYELKYGTYPFESKLSTLNLLNRVKQDQTYFENTIHKFISNMKVRKLLNLKNILNELGILKKQLADIENVPSVITSIPNNNVIKIKKSQFELEEEEQYDDYGFQQNKKKQPSTGSSLHLIQEIQTHHKQSSLKSIKPELQQKTKKKLGHVKRNSISFEDFGNLITSNQSFCEKKKSEKKVHKIDVLNNKSNVLKIQKRVSFQEFNNVGKPINKLPLPRSNITNPEGLLSFDNILKGIKEVKKLENPFYNQIVIKKKEQKLRKIIEELKLQQLKILLEKNSDLIIDFEDLKFEKEIGSGSAGTVYLGTFKGQKIAIKKVKVKENPNALKEFQRQLITLIKMRNSQNLVSLRGLTQDKGQFYLLTEYCEYGSLFDVLHKKVNEISLTWKQKITFALQIAEGMRFLHPNIIHRDLKSLNVFVTKKNQNWKLKVADFGLSRNVQSSMMTTQLGTIHWMAPQLLQSKQYSSSVDVYSFGILVWEILSRKTPYFDIKTPMGILKYVVIDRKRPHLEVIPKDCPESMINLMKKCWSQQPEKRPNFEQLIKRLKQILQITQK